MYQFSVPSSLVLLVLNYFNLLNDRPYALATQIIDLFALKYVVSLD